MKFYIASKFEERLKVRWLMDKLEDLGHEITCDWTDHKYGGEGYPISYAKDDVDGVGSADAYAGLFIDDYYYKGALVEMGMALAGGIPIYIIGHAIDSCIFTNLATQRFESETEFLNFIMRREK